MNILVTGGAGFIGSTLVDRLSLYPDHFIYSIDNFDSFYSRSIKESNLINQKKAANVRVIEADIRAFSNYENEIGPVDLVIHLAAKAGVRPSIDNPQAYFDVNINGTLEMLEFCRRRQIKKFIFASSSSVYGINPKTPWSEEDSDLMPISPYASSKLACEKMGFTYSHLFQIQFLALRFFTVFGPRQRPDLAINKFIQRIANDSPIDVYGDGLTSRDYTYVDDVVQGILSAIEYDKSLFEIFNIGNNHRYTLHQLIDTVSDVLNKKPQLISNPEQPGDVPHTCADISKSQKKLGYSPTTSLLEGVKKQAQWQLQLEKHG